MKLIEQEEFTINDHAYVMTLKDSWREKINLRWFIYQYQELFYNLLSSKSDNATFNKSYVEKQHIFLPSKQHQDEIAAKILEIDVLKEKLSSVENKLNRLLDCEVTC